MTKKKIEAYEFAKMVGGRVVPKNEALVDRIDISKLHKRRLNFSSKEEREDYFLKLIPVMYYTEIEHSDEPITEEMIAAFWMIFRTGFSKIFEDGEEGS